MAIMNINEAAEFFGIDVKVIKRLQKDGLLGKEIGKLEMNQLALLQGVWKRPAYIKMQFAELPITLRKKILIDNKLDNIDKYIYERLKSTEPGKRLSTSALMREIHEKYNKLPASIFSKISNIRRKIHNEKKKTLIANKRKSQINM